jgi:hypothetical protein
MTSHRHLSLLLALGLCVTSMGGCAWYKRDKCYLPAGRYYAMKTLFEETGSMQRVEQAMKQEGWANCERNQFRYWLAKDLGLEELEVELLSTGPVQPPAPPEP